MLTDRTPSREIERTDLFEKNLWANCSFLSFCMAIGIATVCSGCFRTHLPAEQSPSHLPRLIKLAEQRIPLVVHNEQEKQVLGHQYMLILPLSRIYAPYLAEMLADRLALQAGLNKYGLISESNAGLSIPRLEIKIEKARLNGFDLLAIRHPSADLIVKATLFKSDHSIRECTSMQDYSAFRAFAFTKELQETLDVTIDAVAQDLVNCLGFSNVALPYPDSFPNEMY